MLSSKFFLITTKFLLMLIAFLPLFLVCGVESVVGQSGIRSAVYGSPKNSSNSDKSNSSSKKKSAQPTPKTTKSNPPKTNRSAVTSPKSTKKSSSKTQIPVIFSAREANVEIWLNDKNIGVTNDKLQFTKKLAPGEYRLMAKNKRQVLLSTKKITVNSEQTSFNLFEEKTVAEQPVQIQDTSLDLPKEKTEYEIAKEISEKIKEILEKYANPATTDSVTVDDWQLVFQAAQTGQLQGYTAVQIEAQRWFASGMIELAKKEYTNAFTAFNKATEFMPTSALPYYELGNTYLANNQLADAVKLYQKALQIDNKLAMGYKKFGDTQRLLGKEKEALTAYELALQFGYKTIETRYYTAMLRVQNKQIEKGIQELEALSKEVPKAEIFISLGEAFEKLKREVSAIENYQKAINLDENSALAYYRLANIYQNQREYTRAKESFEKAIQLDPNGKVLDIKEAQRKLREVIVKSNK